eukprot:220551-Hanusia_phi.AAC.5
MRVSQLLTQEKLLETSQQQPNLKNWSLPDASSCTSHDVRIFVLLYSPCSCYVPCSSLRGYPPFSFSMLVQPKDVILAAKGGAKLSSLEQFGGQKVQWGQWMLSCLLVCLLIACPSEPLRPENPQYYPNVIYLYTGPETSLYAHSTSITNFKSVLRKDHPEVTGRAQENPRW